MMIPPRVTYAEPLRNSSLYQSYFESLNSSIRRRAVRGRSYTTPNFAGEVSSWDNGILRCTYMNSDYGNDHYRLEVNVDGYWVMAYHCQDSPDRQVIFQYEPGDWQSLID